MEIAWKLSTFENLSTEELYAILQLRQQVFVVEQQCFYQDCDGRDRQAHHLLGLLPGKEQLELVAYLRIIGRENGNKWPSVGRVLTHPDFRRKGLGRKIMRQGLLCIEELYPEMPVYISAQQYLIRFYESFDFSVTSDGYEEDGIPHIEMTRYPTPQNGK